MDTDAREPHRSRTRAHAHRHRCPGDDPVAARFRRHRTIGCYLATVSDRGPVLLVSDDLHWADEETLALLTALATDPLMRQQLSDTATEMFPERGFDAGGAG